MNRVELKNRAKELIVDNKWYILKPVIIFGLASMVITFMAYFLDSSLGLTTTDVVMIGDRAFATNTGGIITDIVGTLVGVAACVFGVAYAYYILMFVRGGKLEMSDIVDWAKEHWIIAILVSLLVGLIIIGCTLLLVIPGIIASFGLMFYQEVCADNLELRPMEIVRKAWDMTNGHKMDLFVLGLSFIGWAIVAIFTLGILYIWLAPYMTITLTLAYEELKK
jgi:hypothetical protein